MFMVVDTLYWQVMGEVLDHELSHMSKHQISVSVESGAPTASVHTLESIQESESAYMEVI